jgi:prefoldin subunit 5
LQVPIHTIGANVQQDAAELQQLRENVVALTAQCAQLDAANHAWQQFQQTQLHYFQTKLQDYLPIDENVSFNDIAQQIIDQISREREEFDEKYQALERANNDLRSGN